MAEKVEITLHINGQSYSVRAEPRRTLVDVIRDDCGLTGTHVGCEHGVCGACTVIVDDEAVRACLMFAVQAHGKRIRTVEGLAQGEKLHPLQEAFTAHHALQCGFCTPGFLMLAADALEKDPAISDDEILDLLSSNLCRCTGYQNIIKLARGAQHRARDTSRAWRLRALVKPGSSWTGRSIRRVEDKTLVTGDGRFTGDLPAAQWCASCAAPSPAGASSASWSRLADW